MEKTKSKDAKGFIFLGLIIILVSLSIFFISKNNKLGEKEISLNIESEDTWYHCFEEVSDIELTYSVNSVSDVDIIFTPTQKDIDNLKEKESYGYYESCTTLSVFKVKDTCIISGEGCFAIRNSKKFVNSRVDLSYNWNK